MQYITIILGASIMPSSVRIYVFGGLLMFPGLVGCGNSSPSAVLPDLPDASAASKAMELYDTNHDGFLDAQELEKAPGLKVAIKQVDTNHDGKISEQEIADRIQSWADSKLGRTRVLCRVTRKGKPLTGAKVVFAPEPFLGGTFQPGSGTTDVRGSALISSPYPQDPAVKGMPPGFYRVEVTKDGESIPAKYNRETCLGVEIAHGSEGLENGIIFDLDY